MRNLLSLDEFTEYMEEVQKQNKFYLDLCNLCDDMDGYQTYSIELPTLENQVVDLLEDIFEDTAHWISYWVYELDFGREYYDGCVTDEVEGDIKLHTIQDLYIFLLHNIQKEGNVNEQV